MDNNAITLDFLLRHPQAHVDPTWVKEMLQAHPTFYLPILLLLKRNPESVEPATRQMLQRIVTLNCADRDTIADFVDPEDRGWADFYPPQEAEQKDTDQTINEFLDIYGSASSPEEDAILERLIFNPVPADYLPDTDTPYDPADPLALPPELQIEPEKAPAEATKEPEERPEEEPKAETRQNAGQKPRQAAEDTLLQESLAKTYIKQRRYERALEIISKLSLNYPEKSVYFADQIRFLQKLIINQQYLDKKQ